jgi:hypothetical protein
MPNTILHATALWFFKPVEECYPEWFGQLFSGRYKHHYFTHPFLKITQGYIDDYNFISNENPVIFWGNLFYEKNLIGHESVN